MAHEQRSLLWSRGTTKQAPMAVSWTDVTVRLELHPAQARALHVAQRLRLVQMVPALAQAQLAQAVQRQSRQAFE